MTMNLLCLTVSSMIRICGEYSVQSVDGKTRFRQDLPESTLFPLTAGSSMAGTT